MVIGVGIITPEGYISYITVHPDWRGNISNFISFYFNFPLFFFFQSGCGIGKNLLFFLINTCTGRDITLHVSVDNPAMILYQKFGFKIEEFVVNFYDKFYEKNEGGFNSFSKHAFFLRLRR